MPTFTPGDDYFNQSGATGIGNYATSPSPNVPEDFWSSGSSGGAEAIGKSAFDPYGIGQEASKESSDEKDRKRRQALELARTQQSQRGGQQTQVSGGSSSGIQGLLGTGTQIVTPGVTVTGGSSGNSLARALGGAATGALAGSSLGPWGMAVGALGGGLSAFG